MSKKPSQQLPNIILVSQDHTNGLFHNVNDQDIIVDVLMEHISMAAFFDSSNPIDGGNSSNSSLNGVSSLGGISSLEDREKYVGDFAMWKIVCKPNLQFQKQDALLSHEELFEFVIQGRKSIPLIQPKNYFFSTIEKMSEDMIVLRDKFKEALKAYIEEIINESF